MLIVRTAVSVAPLPAVVRMRHLKFKRLAVCAVLWALTAAAAFAQSSIIGTLTDPADAVVPGGKITVTQKDTGSTANVQSNESGVFRILNLQPGTYSLRAEATGFSTLELANIVLESAEVRDVGKLKLKVGTVSETLSVSAEATPVQTASSERSAVIDGNQLNDVALKGRDTFGFMRLVPGIVDTTADRSLAGPGSASGISINGMASNSKNVTFDGVTELDQGGSNSVYVNPSMDAVAEVKVLTNGYQAEYGRNSGGTISLVTKNGTQEFHGSGFWNHRNEGLNANSFFNNRSGIQRPIYRYFVGGGTIGGPIYVPGKFNKEKKKLFFFWSEEITKVAQPTRTSTANLPTAAERQGDFSNSRNAAGALIVIKNPQTQLAYANNLIPPSQIDPTGQALLNLFLTPNGYVNPAPGQQFTANSLFSATPSFKRRDDIARIDYNLTKNMLVYARYGHDTSDTAQEFTVSPGVGPLDNFLPGYNWSAHAVNTFSPTLVNDAVYGYGHNSYGFYRINGDKDSNYYRTSTLNPPTLRPFPTGDLYEPYLPSATFAGGSLSSPGSFTAQATGIFNIPYANYNNDQSFQDDLTKILGNHTVKAGVFIERDVKTDPAFGTQYAGSFNFGSSTNNPLDTNDGYANALVGVFQTYAESTVRIAPLELYHEVEGYVQDSWRTSRRVTIDAGLRFYKMALTQDETGKTVANFYPQFFSSANAPRIYIPATVNGKTVAEDPLTGATTFAALQNTIIPGTGNPANGIKINGLTGNGDFTSLPAVVFAPRLGIAWDVNGDGKTAVRASFGIFQQRPDANWLPGRGAPPTTVTPTIYYSTISQIPQAAAAAAVSPDTATEIEGNTRIAHSTQLNFTVQRNIGFGTVVDVGYVGNFDRDALATRQINPIPLGAYGNPANLFNGTEVNANLLRTAYPGMGAIMYQCNCLSDLNYHALQLNAQHRITHGLQFGAAYVFSKALGTTGTDPYHVDRQWYYGPLSQDRSQVFNINWAYQLPGVSNHIAKYFINNWTLSGIASAQTGAPVSPGCSATSGAVSVTDPSLTGGGARCQVVGNPNSFTQSFYTNFNTSAFTLAPPGTFGNAGVGILRQPTWWNMDLTLEKRFPLGKDQKRSIRARIETYNTMNHTEFTAYGTTLQLSGTSNLNTTYGQMTTAQSARVVSTTLRIDF